MTPHPARRRSAWFPAVLIAVGLLLSSVIIWRTSTAAFTSTTSNGTNTFATGTVALSDNDSGTALFTASNLKPGSTGTACIRVTYSGSLASAIKVYGSSASATNSLDTYLTWTVEEGSSGATSFPSCTGFVLQGSLFSNTLATFAASHTGWANGLTATWAPSSTSSRDFRFTYTLSAAAPNSTQNSTAQIAVVWEAQNT
jgi:hypothetical protein